MNDDDLINQVFRKIDREKAIINAANAMRQSSNPQVQQSLDSQVREAQKGISYLEERMRELQLRRRGQGANLQSTPSSAGGGAPLPPAHGGLSPQRGVRNAQQSPPAREGGTGYAADEGDYGDPGAGGYMNDLSGGHGMMPPRAPFGSPPPGSGIPKTRSNYTKLDLIKSDTPYLGPRIQLMLSQLEFKLSVERQYKDGIEKMVRLYQDEGDKRSKADAEGRRIESNQKIQLLKQALKHYEDLHVDMESTADAPDDDSLNSPNMRKPLTGSLSMYVHAVRDVDHAATGRFTRGPETFVIIKVEDSVKGRTRPTRTDKWSEELPIVDIEKANEIELTVYDKSGVHPTPIGMLWIRISDIAEEMRRKKIESELNNSQWVTADKMENSPSQTRQDSTYSSLTSPQDRTSKGSSGRETPSASAGQNSANPAAIDAWFALEPVGSIHLTMSFTKQSKDRRPFDLGLNRKGAIRQRKEEIHELYGHKFVLQQFYNIMRCALCGDFLKYSAGMQCEDCKYTCHKKCYSKVVTKCISTSNAETDPDEEKLNHRIPHRFEGFSNMGANWCCHCGYILPLGRKNCRKCSECGLSCHASCAHLVPDFCGMSMEVANQILDVARQARMSQGKVKEPNLSKRTFRSAPGRPSAQPSISYLPSPAGSQVSQPTTDPRRSHGQEEMYRQDSSISHGGGSPALYAAAPADYGNTQPPPRQNRPDMTPRATSSQTAMNAAAAAFAGKEKRTSSQKPPPYPRSSTTTAIDYSTLSGQRGPGGYGQMDSQGEVGPGSSQPGNAQFQQPQQPKQHAYNPQDYQGYGGYPPQPVPNQSTQIQTAKPSFPEVDRPSSNQPLMRPPVEPKEPPSQQGAGRRIGLEHFNFLAVLGKGNFGKVMLAETKATKKLYAIKVLKKEFIIENDEVESTKSEKRVFLIANKERHPFLLNLHACFQTETRVYFVMEYISGGDLMLHIQRGQFGTKRAQFYAAEVCLALKYFHENGVIYRDLKLDNILLTLDGHIKIADYGLCKEEMWYGSSTSTFCGTPEFMAPEILLDKKYGRAVDWWAFGVLIYQMLLQQSPFRGDDEDEIYDAILADEPLYPIHMPRDSVSILQKLLTREPELRLGSGPTDAQEIMSHSFFRNVNWDDFRDKKVPPPFQPQIKDPTDTSNFDPEFTSVTPVLTPVQSVLTQAMQEEFRGFSYSADFI
ncbi:Serine/threonine kinase [Lobaria immixta]|nr:Serine/threonine kinase [Lobaria immixta]